MDLAVRTTASPAAIWAICVVAVSCLAFWLIMIAYADGHPSVRHGRLPYRPGPVLGGTHLAAGGRSVAPNRTESAVLEDFGTLGAAPEAAAAGQPGGPRVPSQRGPGAPAEHVPAQGPVAPDAAQEAPTEPIPAQRAPEAGQPAAASAHRGAHRRR